MIRATSLTNSFNVEAFRKALKIFAESSLKCVIAIIILSVKSNRLAYLYTDFPLKKGYLPELYYHSSTV